MFIENNDNYFELKKWLRDKKKIFLVCDNSIRYLSDFNNIIDSFEGSVFKFSDFQPNPIYESVVDGVHQFCKEKCDAIIAVGGGSAIDVAKCIKLYAYQRGDGMNGEWLKQDCVPNNIPFLAMPTTAGTGSEATKFAVIYFNGVKQSITSDSIIPQAVLLDPKALKSLPEYQRKSTMMDAFCHALESFWSVNSTEESIEYSKMAIGSIIENMQGYLTNTESGNAGMLMAAHLAGKAINITQTTAGHAMCYKITSIFGISHGHAAILCDRIMFPWMINHIDKCIDPRGKDYLEMKLKEIALSIGADSVMGAAKKIQDIFETLNLEIPVATDDQYTVLLNSVNQDRLKNHPIMLDKHDIDMLYHKILK